MLNKENYFMGESSFSERMLLERAYSSLWAKYPGPRVSYKWIIPFHCQIIGILGRDNWRFLFELLFYYFLIAFPWRKFISSQNHNSLTWNIGITNFPTQICCKDKITFTFSLNKYFYPTLTRHYIWNMYIKKWLLSSYRGRLKLYIKSQQE